ncbi:A24 family peptidase [Dactylosporangium sp. NPDC051485]|uniref:A24 family peptidase n=1 Tax=Dactylosporangium sp. NPDC051485 TaxID=3154846 RepID=UPI003420DD16
MSTVLAGVVVLSAVTAAHLPAVADRLVRPGAPPAARRGMRRWLCGAVGGLGAAALCRHLPAASAPAVLTTAAWLVFLQAGILLTLTDLAVRRLPTPVITGTAAIIAALQTAAAVAAGQPWTLLAGLAGAALFGGGYLTVALLTPTGIGMGDVRLAALIGGLTAATGWDTALLAAVLPYLLGLPFAIGQWRRNRRDGDGRGELPFGPFLAAGAVIAALLPV